MRKQLLLAFLLTLAACGAQPAALAPTSPPPTVPAPGAVLLPTVASVTAIPPTAAPPTATAEPPTIEPPTATALPPTVVPPTAEPPTATAEPPTAVPPTAVPPVAAAPNVAALAADRGDAAAPVRLVIPAIGLDRQLVSVGLDRKRIPVVPNHDVGWYNLSARPGQGDNIVLWGHVLRFKATAKTPAPFARLKELDVGDPLSLYSADGTAHPYVIVEKVWATPDQVEYILPKGRELVTMVSCIGDKVVADGSVEMSHRLITIAAPAGQ